MEVQKRKSPPGALGGIVDRLGRWRLRWKVVAVLALPVAIASVLAASRIQHQLAEAADFRSAVQVARIAPVVVETGSAVDALAVTRLTGGDIVAARDEADAAITALTRALDHSAEARAAFDSALEAVGQLRDRLLIADPPRDLTDRVDTVHVALLSALTGAAQQGSGLDIDQFTEQFDDAWEARRAFTGQRLVIGGSAQGAADTALRVTMPMGAEAAALDRLVAAGVESGELTLLADSADLRRDLVLSRSAADYAGLLADGYTGAAEYYDTLLGGLAADLVDRAQNRAADAEAAALRDTALVIGALLVAFTFALLVAQSLIVPVRRLREGALRTARRDLPAALERIRTGESSPEQEAEASVALGTGEELDELAQAIDQLHGQAIRLAGEQAETRRQVNDMFETLSRRNRALIDQQLGLIEELEHDEADPARLRSLFRLDHLVARMRRNGNNLLVLAGTKVRRNRTAPVALPEVLQAAMSEVEDFHRVRLRSGLDIDIAGPVAPDVVHLLAELLDNALRFSPPDSRVDLTAADATTGGLMLEIVDTGIGMADADMAHANRTLATGGAIGVETARRMGLFVVGRLANRHGIEVTLRRTDPETVRGGVTAAVRIPLEVLVVRPLAQHTRPRAMMSRAGQDQEAGMPSGPRPVLPRRVRNGHDHPDPVTTQLPARIRDPEHIRNGLTQLRSGVDRARQRGSADDSTGPGR
ncbi:sensor histidine kinase [Nocardia farcinica]|uniref:sensor histidine kinase n=1 Tax=Nocardia farcinica TaxID=37329 RepID=UPI002453CBF6|nr:ATP-binding protein [Nocardia farcinica]